MRPGASRQPRAETIRARPCCGGLRGRWQSCSRCSRSTSGRDGRRHDRQATPDAAAIDPDAWRFRVALYGWAPSVAGSLTARGQTVDVNASFIQILQKSNSLIGYMGYFEADKGKVGFYLDTVWAKLGFDRSTTSYRNPIAGLQLSTSSNTAVTYSFAIIEAGGLYEMPAGRVRRARSRRSMVCWASAIGTAAST